MMYLVQKIGKRYTPSQIWTRDGLVTCATHGYQWAVGCRVDSMLVWWERNGYEVIPKSPAAYPPGYFLHEQVGYLKRCIDAAFGSDLMEKKTWLIYVDGLYETDVYERTEEEALAAFRSCNSPPEEGDCLYPGDRPMVVSAIPLK